MKKNNTKKLHFNTLSVTELNSKQLRKIRAGSEAIGDTSPTLTQEFLQTQTNPRDTYSLNCVEDPITD